MKSCAIRRGDAVRYVSVLAGSQAPDRADSHGRRPRNPPDLPRPEKVPSRTRRHVRAFDLQRPLMTPRRQEAFWRLITERLSAPPPISQRQAGTTATLTWSRHCRSEHMAQFWHPTGTGNADAGRSRPASIPPPFTAHAAGSAGGPGGKDDGGGVRVAVLVHPAQAGRVAGMVGVHHRPQGHR